MKDGHCFTVELEGRIKVLENTYVKHAICTKVEQCT